MIDRDRIYVAGAWVPSSGSGTLEVVDAATEEVMARVPEGTPEDVDKAVAAAKAAFPDWSRTPVEERAKYLQRITEGIQARMQEIAEVVAREVGMPINLSTLIQVGLPIMTFASLPQVLDSFEFEERIGNSLVVKEPVGVVGCITPWNYPLHQVSLKVAPALAAGNTVVLKPSEVAPLSAFILAEVIDEVGLPAGTFNLVTGLGTVVGEAIVAHPDVDMISFTGSTRAGRRVAEAASATVKRVSLELGGKSPNVILPDADLAKAVRAGVNAAFLNSGQTCIALSRMIVPRSRLDEVEQLVVQVAEEYRPGNPFEATTRLGPVASAEQQQRVRSYIEKGIEEGAKLLTGGPEAPEGLDRGYFVQPTVFSEVHNDMTIAQEEIFGPVLSIIPYDDEDEAVEIANDTIYGLAAGVWAGDTDKALEVARRLRAGMVEVNGGSFNPLAPFGGYKQSGSGREAGKYGLEEFLEVKSMQL
ncbi:MAG: aldehyde dehydrogenase family protein [Actinobacteria bacterium]|nr:aldehyde dehydrogenase family protein [Actinomycetota bacterium]